jgi:Glycosyl hydrolases family 38 C-terminal domain.
MRSEGLFYTDTNSRETLERNYKLFALEEPVSGNYYPINSKIAIKDKHQDFEIAIITDRPQGGTSMQEGQMELMVRTSFYIKIAT